jgi:hypothetical protein
MGRTTRLSNRGSGGQRRPDGPARRATAVKQQLATPAPQVSPKGWALHVRVFDSRLQPLAGYTVFLADAEKSFQRAFGFAYTDRAGYFLINYPGGNDTAGAAGLFVEVADANGNRLSQRRPVHAGGRIFNLSEHHPALDTKRIGNPPAPMRDVGLPAKKR